MAPETFTYYLQLKKGEIYQDFQNAVDNDPCVLYVSDTRIVKPTATTNDSAIGSQEHLKTIDAFNAWDTINDSQIGVTEDVVVAIIDSGVDSRHEDLRDNMWNNSREIPGNGRDDDNNGYVDDIYGYNFADNNANAGPANSSTDSAHGTHVAGLTGATGNNRRGGSGVLGHHIKLMALNVFGSSSGAFSVNIDNAIRYAADNGADVINMSLGGCGYTASTDQALAYAINKGVVVVVAAGNDGSEISANPQDSSCGGFGGRFFDTPASFGSKYDGMITVASTDAVSSAMSSFSNYSRSVVEMAAPGSANTSRGLGLYSTLTGSKYGRMMGTSMASPVVAGAAAAAIGLMKSRGVRHSNFGIENLLKNSAQKLSSLSSRVKDGNHLSLSRLVDEINRSFPPAQPDPPDDPGQPDPPADQPTQPDPPVDPDEPDPEPPVFGPPTLPDGDPSTSPPVAGPAPGQPDTGPSPSPGLPFPESPQDSAPICN